jgi:hypothetical protein
MTTITERYDAGAGLGGAPDGGMGKYIEDLKDSCGFLISKIDWVVEKVTGTSLLEELFKPIAGDFDAVSSMQKGWGEIGVALGAVGDNYSSLADQLPGVWTGPAAQAAAGRLDDVAEMHARQQEASAHIQDQLGHVIEVAQATAEVIAAALNFIDSVVQEVLLDMAAGPLGVVKGAFSAPGKARKIISLISRGLEAISKFTHAVRAVVVVLKYVNAGLAVTDTVLQLGSTAASKAAGDHMDDTSRHGF